LRPLLRLLPLLRARLGLLTACAALLFAGAGLGLAGPWLIAHAIDVDLATGDVAGLRRTALAFGLVVLANLAAHYLGRIGVERVAQAAIYQLRRQLFGHLVRHDAAFHDEHSSGRLITRVEGDTQALHVLFTEVILATPPDLAMLVGVAALLFDASPQVAWMVLAVIPPYLLAFAIFRKVAPPRFLAVRKIRARLTGFFSEHLRAMPALQGMDRDGWARAREGDLSAEVYAAEIKADLLPVYYFNGLVMIRSLAFAGVLTGGALLVSRGAATVGVLVMALGYLRQMFNPLMRLSHHLNTIERARAAAIRVADIMDRPRRLVAPPDPAPWPGLTEAIRLEGVHFAYDPESPVLRGLDLTIPAGHHVGVVGATGSGKSTLLNLLLRFRDPDAGQVTVDGVPLTAMDPDALRARAGLVLQDVHLFPGTVLENLGGDAAAAQAAMDTLGVDFDLGMTLEPGGGNLSQGERQLLTFARALVNDPPLLLMDEATSAVDPATEARIQAALERLRAGRTAVTVAHRLATVRGCDTIVVLAEGRLVERGPHDALMARGGLYAALYRLQQGEAA